MIDPVYTPIIKSKLGEVKALMRLDSWVKSNIVPFFDVLALKAETPNGSDVNAHMEEQSVNIAAAWNGRGPCYVDFFDVVPSARGVGGEHPVTIVYEKLAFNRVDVIPVVGVERDIAYKLAIRRVVSGGVDAIAVRLGDEDIQLPSVLADKVATLVLELGATDLPLHIFMDFRSIEGLGSDVIRMRFKRAFSEVQKLKPARVVFAASAIVSDMRKFKKNSLNKVARRDFLVWELIAGEHPDVDYADYGVISPDYLDIDKSKIRPAAKIRYASDKEWFIVKGIKWSLDTSQYRGLSKTLCGEVEFRGDDCWGGRNIVAAARGGHVYRRLVDWVTIDTNTHVTHTVKQLSRVKVAKDLSV